MLLTFQSKSQILFADFSCVELEAVKQLRHGCSRHVPVRALRVNCSLGVTAGAELGKKWDSPCAAGTYNWPLDPVCRS